MKATKILVAAAAVATLTLANRLNAGDLYVSPRAAEQRSHTAVGTNTDPNMTVNQDRSVSPRTQELRTKAANGKNNDRNLLAGIRTSSGTPKSLDVPGADTFQVAPVK